MNSLFFLYFTHAPLSLSLYSLSLTGLIDDSINYHNLCLSSTCFIVNDAWHCCKPAADAATCASVADPSTFCMNDGSNGLINNPDKSLCSTSTCSPLEDGRTCCKPAPPALLVHLFVCLLMVERNE